MKNKTHRKQNPIKQGVFSFCLTCLILAIASPVQANDTRSEIGDTALSSDAPHIPEPMVFDLVRPLGVRQGDLEVNTLSGHSLRSGRTEWAPEIEFGLFDNLAVEFELPFDQLSLSEYKMAIQGTFGAEFNNRFIHGWQMIGYHDRKERKYTIDGLYLAGFRWNSAISNFNMIGLRRENVERDGHFVGLFNTSWFYDYSQKLTLGVEMNNEFSRESEWHYLLMPQVHWDFNDHATLQVGTGFSQVDGRQTDWLGTWRMVYAF
ncbi:MAG: hypothetical protein Q7T40_11430 [Methylobacter sp.]|nr:hypothetical protein [Methylobacter sp.]